LHFTFGRAIQTLFSPYLVLKKFEGDDRGRSREYRRLRRDVHLALAFICAHQHVQARIKKEFVGKDPGADSLAAYNVILRESNNEIKKAEKVLESSEENDVRVIISHLLCIILLNKRARHIEGLSAVGFLTNRDAHHYLEEIERALDHLRRCSSASHGEMSQEDKNDSLRRFVASIDSSVPANDGSLVREE